MKGEIESIVPPPRPSVRRVLFLIATCILVAGCDYSPFDRTERGMDEGEQRQAARDFRGAVNAYEHALDGTAKTSEAHFRLGLIYAERLNDEVSAVHHFRRYMELSPGGLHVKEAQANLTRLELTLATKLAGGTLISHTEATKLKAENTELRKQLAARDNPALAAGPVGTAGKPGARDASGKPAPGSKTYVVQPGDTMASIARKFYKNKARAKDIQDANLNSVPNVAKLKPGQTLIIP